MTGFVIFAFPVAEGILAISPMPGSGGDYQKDLRHLADWKPALVVSLTTEAELGASGAVSLGPDLQDAGTRWVHLPLEDYSAPDITHEDQWHEISRNALGALQGGGRVLFHCRGGCGRSGMAALRLMIEAGEAPQAALKRLRSIRPCAVETNAQMDWAMQG